VLILYLLKWLFSVPGIQSCDRPGPQLKLFGKTLFTFNISPGLYYRPGGPTTAETANWMKYGRVLVAHKCVQCGATVWAWKKVRVCGRFSCFRKNKGKWK